MVRLGRRLLLLTPLLAGFLLAPAAVLAQTATPTPSISPSPGAPGAGHTAGFWIVFLVLAGLLAIYRLRLWRGR